MKKREGKQSIKRTLERTMNNRVLKEKRKTEYEFTLCILLKWGYRKTCHETLSLRKNFLSIRLYYLLSRGWRSLWKSKDPYLCPWRRAARLSATPSFSISSPLSFSLLSPLKRSSTGKTTAKLSVAKLDWKTEHEEKEKREKKKKRNRV